MFKLFLKIQAWGREAVLNGALKMVFDTQFLFTLLKNKKSFCRLTLSDNIFQQLRLSIVF